MFSSYIIFMHNPYIWPHPISYCPFVNTHVILQWQLLLWKTWFAVPGYGSREVRLLLTCFWLCGSSASCSTEKEVYITFCSICSVFNTPLQRKWVFSVPAGQWKLLLILSCDNIYPYIQIISQHQPINVWWKQWHFRYHW